MRHKKSGRKLGRNPSHRKALLRNMAKALLLGNGRITTTEAKAKTLRGVVEPLITLALKNDLHARRQAYTVLGDHKLVQRLFDEIGPLYKGGGGGYTRVIKLAYPRKGDAAPLAIIELTRKPGEEAQEPVALSKATLADSAKQTPPASQAAPEEKAAPAAKDAPVTPSGPAGAQEDAADAAAEFAPVEEQTEKEK